VSSIPNQERAPKLPPRLAFSVLCAVSLGAWWAPLTSSFALALSDERYTHILLILPVSAALIFLDWKPPQPFGGLSLGSVFLVAAGLAAVVVRWKAIPLPSDGRLALNMVTVVVWWIGAFLLCFGIRAARSAVFPLCFLFWTVPLPEFVLNPIVSLLQRGSAAAAHLLFEVAGVPVAQRGMLIHVPGLTVEVARECSSIRSSLMLVVTTMVLAQILLRSPWRKALIIAAAIPLSVAKNGLRIFAIVMLATRVDPSFLTGRLHRQGGIIFFLIALAVISLLLWIARRGEEKEPESKAGEAV